MEAVGLDGRTVLVTGCATGLGHGILLALADRGAVCRVDRSYVSLENTETDGGWLPEST